LASKKQPTKLTNCLALIEGSAGRKQHLVLFYENEKDAMNIECEFIKNGLSRQEYCIFSTGKNVNSVKEDLINFGIDVDHFKKRGLLDIQKMIELEGADAFKNVRETVSDFLKQKPDLSKRIVGRYASYITTRHDANAGIAAEKFCNSIFADLNGSLLCPYQVKKVPLKERARWMFEMMKNHDVAIFVDKKGQGQVIDL
jgi:hypothetical protein